MPGTEPGATKLTKLIADFINPDLDVEGLLAGAKQKFLSQFLADVGA